MEISLESRLHKRIENSKRSQEFRFINEENWLPANVFGNALDLGCGSGLYTKFLSEKGISTVAFDIDLKSLKTADDYVKDNNLRNCCGTGAFLPFKDSVFDLVVCIEALSHLCHKDHNLVIKECHRVLKKDGVMIISVHNKIRFYLQNISKLKKPTSVIFNPGLDIYTLSKNEFQKGLEKVGFHFINNFFFKNFFNSFHNRYPAIFYLTSKFEDLISKIPILNRFGITILTIVKK